MLQKNGTSSDIFVFWFKSSSDAEIAASIIRNQFRLGSTNLTRAENNTLFVYGTKSQYFDRLLCTTVEELGGVPKP